MSGQEEPGKWLGVASEGVLKEGALRVLLNLGVTGSVQLPKPNKPIKGVKLITGHIGNRDKEIQQNPKVCCICGCPNRRLRFAHLSSPGLGVVILGFSLGL